MIAQNDENRPQGNDDGDMPMMELPGSISSMRAVRQAHEEYVASLYGEMRKALDTGESGDAALLSLVYRNRLMYDYDAGVWYQYGAGEVPHTWVISPRPPVDAVMRELGSLYLTQAALMSAVGDLGQSREFRERGKLMHTVKRAKNVLEAAAGLSHLGRKGIQWDANPMLLSVRNGVIELDSGTFRKGQPEDRLTIFAETEWVGIDAAAPRWEGFIESILSEESDRVAFMRRLLGYAVNGTTREHIVVLMIGPRGRNGKGVMLKTLDTVLGPYASDVPRKVLLQQDESINAGGPTPHLMKLRGLRVAYVNESEEGHALSGAELKSLTGGDAITARGMRQDFITFKPTHTLFLATNNPPMARADDDALHERLVVLNFKRRFVERPMTADEYPIDKDLDTALAAESSGILAWLVRGHLEYLREGLRVPESMLLARHQFRNRQSIEGWLHERTYIDGVTETRGTALYEDYVTWCGRQGMVPQSQTWFGRQLRALAVHGVEKKYGVGGITLYLGIGLRDDEPPLAAAQPTLPAVGPMPPMGHIDTAVPDSTPTVPAVAAVGPMPPDAPADAERWHWRYNAADADMADVWSPVTRTWAIAVMRADAAATGVGQLNGVVGG